MPVVARRVRVAALVGLTAAAGLVASAGGQDCKLSVSASPSVVWSGQSAQVNVFAHFPSTAYAFAGAQFEVASSDPKWTLASSGAIVGNDIVGAAFSQPHAPRAGVFADSANPLRIWNGRLTPTSAAPAIIEVKADASAFGFYPSRLTSSWVPGDAMGGRDLLFVNPIRVGDWGIAPGDGTTVRISDDVIVDGRIITAENYDSGPIVVGLAPLAAQRTRITSVSVTFDRPPQAFGLTTKVLGNAVAGDPIPTEQVAVNFTKIKFEYRPAPRGGGAYVAVADVPEDGVLVTQLTYPDGRVETLTTRGPVAPCSVPNLSEVVVTKITDSGSGGLFVAYELDYRGGVPVLMQDGSVRTVRMVSVSVPLRGFNNLKQIGLGAHVYGSEGCGEIRMFVYAGTP